jgi:glycosyltransferase involved in cell wall biosynthesis
MTGNPNKNLVIITVSYPFGTIAESFLDSELPYLSKMFDSVVIIPRSYPPEVERVERVLPANVSVNTSLLSLKPQKMPLKIINYAFAAGRTTYLYKEIFRRPQILIEIPLLKRAINYLYEAFRVQKWALKYIEQNNIDLTRTVFYTFWLDYATLGIGLTKKKYTEIKLVSRAHDGDLYEERHSPPYLPYRLELFRALDHLYLISNHGKTYITDRYFFLNSKCSLSRLGVKMPGFLSRASLDGILRIVSCSYIVPVKRIHLIIWALKELGLCRPDLKIEWAHIGYGPLLGQMEKCTSSSLPKNVVYKFTGILPNSEVLSYYQHNSIDVFINVSAWEGIPGSIMEAQSCGIPVIATAVGGTPEIVSEKVGFLISENPSPTEIADALGFFADHPDITQQMRLNSIANWDSHYNASKNFTEFANSLKMM